MKFYAAVLIVTLMAVVAVVQAGDELRAEYCKGDTADVTEKCAGRRCNKENTMFGVVGCAEVKCRHGVLRVEEDLSKPYPDCCPRPVCKPAA